ncbi:N-acetylmuramoyl-L-alanine amidase [Nocardiopsis ansamitocini]|uniref:N-acetylmuramoyl-L-alanine amidase n=1 Tax=Nocardiopsis ansamitocini TaxID=1670832 RepID=A0A9W6P8W2_9ACTN|nr:N-acetylmuramoyl-L-alanine amidase [Nocardiopsis ansamitocini]GLU49146.1 N-acetylmuramoyl-L-alanine amidase [Nocardiopsis ansamitocini]
MLCLSLATGCAGSLPEGARPNPEGTADLPLPTPGAGETAAGDNAAPPRPQLPLSGATVVVDPGHNGGNAEAASEINKQVPAGPEKKACDTVGASTGDGYPEHEFNWDLSLRVRDRLAAEGATVVLTRPDNKGVGPCVNERAQIGNDAEADVAISIHADGGPASGRGFHVIAPGEVAGYTEPILEPSRILAEDLRDEFVEVQPHADYLADEGLDFRTDLGGLNMSTVPKVFLEVGNMRNSTDAANLTDPDWRDEAAEAITAGLSRYLLRD